MRVSKTAYISFSFLFVAFWLIGCGNNEKNINDKISKTIEDKKIQKLTKERDEAIEIALNISKNLKKINNKELNAIQNIENARDEAIYVSLGIQQKNRELQSKIDKVDREHKQDIQYFEKTIAKLKKEEDRDHLKRELKQYRLENRRLKSNIKKVQRSKKIEIRDIKREAKLKTRTIDNLASQIQKHKKTNTILKEKFAKVAQSQKKSDEAIRIALNINRDKEKLEAKIKGLNTKIAQLLNNSITKFKIPKVKFKSDSTVLTKQSSQLLDKIVSIIKEYPKYNYEIQGHTDSYGNESYNLQLSTMRAKSVNDYLLSKGIEENSLSFKGFGSSKPIADNNTKDGRDKNRRVHIKVE